MNYVPPLQEYLKNGATSSCIFMLGLSTILGMGHTDTIGAFKWAMKKPKAVFAAEKMGRIINDIVGYEVSVVYDLQTHEKLITLLHQLVMNLISI